MQGRAVRAIVCAGLLAGVLDITAAFAYSALRGVGPVRVLRFIAFVPSMTMVVIHMLCVGLPIAVVLRHFARDPEPP